MFARLNSMALACKSGSSLSVSHGGKASPAQYGKMALVPYKIGTVDIMHSITNY